MIAGTGDGAVAGGGDGGSVVVRTPDAGFLAAEILAVNVCDTAGLMVGTGEEVSGRDSRSPAGNGVWAGMAIVAGGLAGANEGALASCP